MRRSALATLAVGAAAVGLGAWLLLRSESSSPIPDGGPASGTEVADGPETGTPPAVPSSAKSEPADPDGTSSSHRPPPPDAPDRPKERVRMVGWNLHPLQAVPRRGTRPPLEAGTPLRGQAFRWVKGRKEPVAGVRVEVYVAPFPRDLDNVLLADPIRVVTGEDGRFETKAPPGTTVILRGDPSDPLWSLQDGGDILLEVPPEGEPAVKDLPVHRRGSASGIVLDGADRPVPGATVAVVRAGGPWVLRADEPFVSVTAGPDGRFLLPGLPAQTAFQAVASKPPMRRGLSKAFQVREEGKVEGLEIRLLPGATVRGRVAFEDGSPAADAVVALTRGDVSSRGSWQPPPFLSADMPDPEITGEDGTFAFEGVEAPFMVWVTAWGERFRQVSGSPAGVQVTDDGAEVPTIVVRRIHPVAGRVVDEEGRPVENATVNVVPGSPNSWPQPVTDAGGRFEVLLFAEPQRIQVLCREHVQEVPIEIQVPLRMPLEVRVKRGLHLSGRALDADGGPPPRIRIYAFDGNGRVGGMARPDGEGRFSILLGNPGPWRLLVDPASAGFRRYGPVAAPVDTVELRAEKGDSLEGVVRGSDGSPLAGANVQAMPSPAERTAAGHLSSAFAVTDREGRFRIEGLVEESYDVEVRAPGVAGSRTGVRPGTTDLVLVAEPAGPVHYK